MTTLRWGDLIPLSPFVDATKAGNGKAGANAGCLEEGILKPLAVPGSFGREALLRQFSKACPDCSRCRHGNVKSPGPPQKRANGRTPLCDICRSIQSMAKFIPRKDFWCFSCDGSGGVEGRSLRLVISGKNTSQLVRICSSSGVVRQSNNPQEYPRKLSLYDGDVLSLLGYNKQNGGEGAANASLKLETVLRFRLALAKEEHAVSSAVDRDFENNQVAVSLLLEEKKKSHDDVLNSAIVEVHKKRHEDVNYARVGHPEERKKNEDARDKYQGIGNGKQVTCDNGDGTSPTSSDDTHPRKAVSVLKTTAGNEEKVARGNYFGDAREQYVRDCCNMKQQTPISPGSSRHESSHGPPTLGGDASCAGSVNESLKDDGESESAPLSLPSRFLESDSKSFSFDSPEKSPRKCSKSYGEKDAEHAQHSEDTPRKSEIRSKRAWDDVQSSGVTKDATRTPKKSNVTKTHSMTSVPISSYSYDELVQLLEETKPTKSHPSLRHAVLSLTLALTSNASSWDSEFLKDCNKKSNAKSEADERSILPRDATQKWMPRLLQGTHINISQKDRYI